MSTPVTDLTWRGDETIDAATTALARRRDVALHLPAEVHYAVAVQLGAVPDPASAQEVDVSGGAELLTQLSAIRGLESLTALVPPVENARARVQVQSPSPTVAIRCSGDKAPS